MGQRMASNRKEFIFHENVYQILVVLSIARTQAAGSCKGMILILNNFARISREFLGRYLVMALS